MHPVPPPGVAVHYKLTHASIWGGRVVDPESEFFQGGGGSCPSFILIFPFSSFCYPWLSVRLALNLVFEKVVMSLHFSGRRGIIDSGGHQNSWGKIGKIAAKLQENWHRISAEDLENFISSIIFLPFCTLVNAFEPSFIHHMENAGKLRISIINPWLIWRTVSSVCFIFFWVFPNAHGPGQK